MAGVTTWNKSEAPAGTEPWNYAAQVKRALDKAGLVFGVASSAERDGLAALAPGGVLPIPTLIWRTDKHWYETWDGTAWQTMTGMRAVNDNSATSTGIAGTEVLLEAISSVSLIKDHKYEILYELTHVSSAADLPFALTLKKSLTSDTGITGTAIRARTFWTAPTGGSGSYSVIRGLYTPTSNETVRVIATMQRLAGSAGIDISGRVLSIEDKGYLP